MGAVMIACPHTGKVLYTGIDTDAVTFNRLPDVPTPSPCPYCGFEHMWWKREAWLSDPTNGSSSDATS